MHQKSKKWIKRVRTELQILSMKTWDFFFHNHFMKRRNEKLYFPIKTVYDLYSRYTSCWSFRTQNIKANQNNSQNSLWYICEAVWLLSERVHVASINEFKSRKAKLLTLPWVTTCFNLWKFVRVSYSNCLLLWKTYFQKVTSQPLFTDSKSNK